MLRSGNVALKSSVIGQNKHQQLQSDAWIEIKKDANTLNRLSVGFVDLLQVIKSAAILYNFRQPH